MKILIIHVSAGAGHTKAAEALFNAASHLGVEVQIVDALDYTNPFYKKIYQTTYSTLVTKFPWAWGFFFGLVDLKFLRIPVKYLRRLMNSLNSKRLESFLREEQFDWVFSTHFFSNEVTAYLKRKGVIYPKIVSVVTDFDVHSIWLAEGIDYYTGACDFSREKLLQLGVSLEKTLVAGIPTDEKFSYKKDKVQLRRKLGLKENIFTVLVATGSFGIGPFEKIIEALEGLQTIVVCGRNQTLYERLSQRFSGRAKVCGLVDNMDELMAASDSMITKPGGLSISEALVSGLPLIFFNAIPGQETHNIQVLKRYGIGISGCSIEEMARELKKLNSSPQLLKEVQAHTQRLAKPHSARDILNIIHAYSPSP